MTLAEIIKALEERDLSQEQIAKMLVDRGVKVSQSTVSRIKSGAVTPRQNLAVALYELAVEQGIIEKRPLPDYNNLTFIEEIDVYHGLGGGALPIVSQNAANATVFDARAVRGVWFIPDYVLARFNVRPEDMKAFVFQGDAMAPTIQNGDYVFIDTRHRVPSPPGIYALADNFGGITIRRVEVISPPNEKTIRIRVICDNPIHPPQEYYLTDYKVIGRYVGRFTA